MHRKVKRKKTKWNMKRLGNSEKEKRSRNRITIKSRSQNN